MQNNCNCKTIFKSYQKFINIRSYSVQKTKGKAETSSIQYCLDLVRKHDYENFLCTLLLPNIKSRSGVFAIRAFNTELALVRDQVTKKETGLARLAFWRDSIGALYSATKSNELVRLLPRQPVVYELFRTIKESGDLSKKWFINMIESREKSMNDSPFITLNELENYCDLSSTSLLYLGLEITGAKNLEIDHVASHVGKAVGLTNFLRSIPYNSQRRIVLVPQDLLIKHKTSQENFVRLKEPEKIKEIAFEIASQAHIHLEKAKALKNNLTKETRPLFLCGYPAEIYLERLQKANFNLFDSSLAKKNGLLPIHLLYKKHFKNYF